MRNFYVFLLLNISFFTAYTQVLTVTRDNSYVNVPCSDGESNACIIIVADTSLHALTFYSDIDPNDGMVDVVSTNTIGSNISYTLSFLTGSIFKKRILEVFSPLYEKPAQIPLDLNPKESRKYYVALSECYNVHLKNAADLFTKSAYAESKEEYKQARECFDALADGEVVMKTAIIDSILFWRKMADASFDLLDYREARDYYNKIGKYNPQDDYVLNRSKESSQKHNQYCMECFSKAEVFFNISEHQQAKILYGRVINQNCQQRLEATARLKEMIADSVHRLDKTTVLTYEFASNTFIGFSVGGYKNKTGGGFFTLKTNPAFFNMLRSKESVRPEINASAGGNFRPVKNKYVPLWINIGLGWTGVGAYYYTDENENKILYDGEKLPDNIETSLTLYHAISPEIGLLGKIPLGQKASVGIALRYTFQYRFALNPDAQDDIIKPVAHGFGIGFCF